MKRSLFLTSVLFALASLGGCAVAPIVPDAGPIQQPTGQPDGGQSFEFSDASTEAAANPSDGAACDPPDMLVILDRSESMSTYVGTQGTRIDLAISAIDFITQAPTDTTVRFGLQVLPQIGGTTCSTQLVVPMGLNNSGAISTALTKMSPQLDFGTPIGAALSSAATTLKKIQTGTRKQYVLLLTDGGECCSCSTHDNDLAIAQALYAQGIEMYVVGFGGDDDPVLLNDLACAGHTATNVQHDCTCTTAGCRASSQIVASTTPLYFKASDGVALKKALATITNQTCCNCNLPPN